MKNKTTAIILALFLGGLGIHKFYLNKPLWGIVYLLFSWTFIPVIASFIEIIVLLFYSDEKFNQKYNKKYIQKTENEISTDDVFSVSSKKAEGNATEFTINVDKEKLEAFLIKKQQNRENEIKNFNYIPNQIQRQGIQLLESIYLLNTTKNIDTLKGRFEFISQMYDDFIKASYNKRYLSDIQKSLDEYKSMYYDRIVKDFEIRLAMKPNFEELIDYYSACIFNCFNQFVEEQEKQISELKKEEAKNKRIEKIIEVGNEAIFEFDKNGSKKDQYKSHLTSIKNKIDSLSNSETTKYVSLTSINNPVVINKGSSFELTLYNTDTKQINKVIDILKNENLWNKTKELLPLFAQYNIKCKEVEGYINKYKPVFYEKIKVHLEKSDEYQGSSEMDKVEIENEIKNNVLNELYERADCDIQTLFDFSDIDITIDDKIIERYGFAVIHQYLKLNYYKDKIVSHLNRKDFEDLIKADLVYTSEQIDQEELLNSQTLKTLNLICDKEEGFFKRKNKAIEFLKENPALLNNIGKHVSTRNLFKLKPLPVEFDNLDTEQLRMHWDFLSEYIKLIVDTYRNSEYAQRDKLDGKSWVKEFRVEKHEDYSPDFVCLRAREESKKRFSKSNPPKVPFHVGCNCHLRTEI